MRDPSRKCTVMTLPAWPAPSSQSTGAPRPLRATGWVVRRGLTPCTRGRRGHDRRARRWPPLRRLPRPRPSTVRRASRSARCAVPRSRRRCHWPPRPSGQRHARARRRLGRHGQDDPARGLVGRARSGAATSSAGRPSTARTTTLRSWPRPCSVPSVRPSDRHVPAIDEETVPSRVGHAFVSRLIELAGEAPDGHVARPRRPAPRPRPALRRARRADRPLGAAAPARGHRHACRPRSAPGPAASRGAPGRGAGAPAALLPRRHARAAVPARPRPRRRAGAPPAGAHRGLGRGRRPRGRLAGARS